MTKRILSVFVCINHIYPISILIEGCTVLNFGSYSNNKFIQKRFQDLRLTKRILCIFACINHIYPIRQLIEGMHCLILDHTVPISLFLKTISGFKIVCINHIYPIRILISCTASFRIIQCLWVFFKSWCKMDKNSYFRSP